MFPLNMVIFHSYVNVYQRVCSFIWESYTKKTTQTMVCYWVYTTYCIHLSFHVMDLSSRDVGKSYQSLPYC